MINTHFLCNPEDLLPYVLTCKNFYGNRNNIARDNTYHYFNIYISQKDQDFFQNMSGKPTDENDYMFRLHVAITCPKMFHTLSKLVDVEYLVKKIPRYYPHAPGDHWRYENLTQRSNYVPTDPVGIFIEKSGVYMIDCGDFDWQQNTLPYCTYIMIKETTGTLSVYMPLDLNITYYFDTHFSKSMSDIGVVHDPFHYDLCTEQRECENRAGNIGLSYAIISSYRYKKNSPSSAADGESITEKDIASNPVTGRAECSKTEPYNENCWVDDFEMFQDYDPSNTPESVDRWFGDVQLLFFVHCVMCGYQNEINKMGDGVDILPIFAAVGSINDEIILSAILQNTELCERILLLLQSPCPPRLRYYVKRGLTVFLSFCQHNIPSYAEKLKRALNFAQSGGLNGLRLD